MEREIEIERELVEQNLQLERENLMIDLDEYYTKTETDNLLSTKANTSDIPDVSDFITNETNSLTNYYNKSTMDGKLLLKANLTDLPDVSNFVTKSANNLENYYLKNETYTQAEVQALLSNLPLMNIEIVEQLPTSDISPTTIYLLVTGTTGLNQYDEYIYVDNHWEKIGSANIDLSNYYTKTETNSLLNGKADTSSLSTVATSGSYADLSNKPTIPTNTSDLTNNSGFITNTDYATPTTAGVIFANKNGMVVENGIPKGSTQTYSLYNQWADTLFINKGTLENVITGKGLVSNTDYANGNTAGVIKTNTYYGTAVDSTGNMYATIHDYANYQTSNDSKFISKGTLENVITGKGLVSNADYANATTGGVIHGNVNGFIVSSSSGNPSASEYTYAQYQNLPNYQFIGKGTLENVITGKSLVSNTDYANSSTGGVLKISGAFGTLLSSGTLIGSVIEYANYDSASNNAFICKGTLENAITGKGLVDSTSLSTTLSSYATQTYVNSAIASAITDALGGSY